MSIDIPNEGYFNTRYGVTFNHIYIYSKMNKLIVFKILKAFELKFINIYVLISRALICKYASIIIHTNSFDK